MNNQTSVKSAETTKEQEMTLLLLLSYNRMQQYNENLSKMRKIVEEKYGVLVK